MIGWIRRVLGIPEPVAEIVIRRREPPPESRKTKYRYTVQSGTFCRVLRVLLVASKPMTTREIASLLDTTTTAQVIVQLKADGLIVSERRTVGSAIRSHTLTDAGRELAASIKDEA